MIHIVQGCVRRMPYGEIRNQHRAGLRDCSVTRRRDEHWVCREEMAEWNRVSCGFIVGSMPRASNRSEGTQARLGHTIPDPGSFQQSHQAFGTKTLASQTSRWSSGTNCHWCLAYPTQTVLVVRDRLLHGLRARAKQFITARRFST